MRRNNFLNPEEKARAYAFLLLKFRQRSSHELSERLKRKRFAPEVVAGTIDFLKEKNFIDDEAFTRAWVNSRLAKNLGARRIKQELRLKGIPEAVINAQVRTILADHPEEAVIKKLAKVRLNRIKGEDPRKARQKVYAYLVRRGFSPASVIDVLETL